MRQIFLCLAVPGFLLAIDPTKIQNKIPSSEYSISLEADYMFIWQDPKGQHRRTLVSTTDGVTSDPVNPQLLASAAEKVFTYGLKGSIKAAKDPYWDVEIDFLGLVNWRRITGAHSEASTLVTNVYGVENFYDWVQAANVETNSKQQFDYVNIGPWFHSAPRGRDYFRFSTYTGLRYVYYNDRLQMTSQRASDISHFYTTCKNDLGGALVGVELEATPMNYFSWSVTLLGGLYADFMKKTSILYDFNDTVIQFNYDPNLLRAAYSFEINPLATIRVNRHICFNVGYMFMYMKNIAMSAYQISPKIKNYSIWYEGALRFQTVTMGLSATF